MELDMNDKAIEEFKNTVRREVKLMILVAEIFIEEIEKSSLPEILKKQMLDKLLADANNICAEQQQSDKIEP